MTVDTLTPARAASPVDDPAAALRARFGPAILAEQATAEAFPVLWVAPEKSPEIHRFLKDEIDRPYALLTDLWGIDETAREHRAGQPPSSVTVASHLVSPDRNADIRLKVACDADRPQLPTLAGIYPATDWYEREDFDMLGVRFDGHNSHRRILMPNDWQCHPLRKTIKRAPPKNRPAA